MSLVAAGLLVSAASCDDRDAKESLRREGIVHASLKNASAPIRDAIRVLLADQCRLSFCDSARTVNDKNEAYFKCVVPGHAGADFDGRWTWWDSESEGRVWIRRIDRSGNSEPQSNYTLDVDFEDNAELNQVQFTFNDDELRLNELHCFEPSLRPKGVAEGDNVCTLIMNSNFLLPPLPAREGDPYGQFVFNNAIGMKPDGDSLAIDRRVLSTLSQTAKDLFVEIKSLVARLTRNKTKCKPSEAENRR